jgi:hypothetical protein
MTALRELEYPERVRFAQKPVAALRLLPAGFCADPAGLLLVQLGSGMAPPAQGLNPVLEHLTVTQALG